LAIKFDEVQCGVGRTGKWFAYQNSSIKRDVVTLAKGLASGYPLVRVLLMRKLQV